MEARLEAIPSPVSLWWTKLGQRQVLATLLTLGAFFITLGVTGDTKNAIVIAFTAAFTIAFAAAFVGVAFTAVALTIAFAAAFVGVVAFATASVAVVVVTTVAFAAIAIVAIAIVAAADEIIVVSKRAIWISYVGEFLLILLPMLWVVRG